MGTFGTGSCRSALAVVAAAVALAACSSIPTPSMPSLPSSSWFSSSRPEPATAADASAAVPEAKIECPSVSVRRGASTYTIYTNPADQSALNVRYQATVVDTARECHVVNRIVTMRVGVQGRVIVGPAGAPPQVEVPLRLAVVMEGIEPKPITTKLVRIPVTVPPGDMNVLFTHVEEQVSFPQPPGDQIDSYIVYVGFDALAVREPPVKKKPAPKPKPKPKPAT